MKFQIFYLTPRQTLWVKRLTISRKPYLTGIMLKLGKKLICIWSR